MITADAFLASALDISVERRRLDSCLKWGGFFASNLCDTYL